MSNSLHRYFWGALFLHAALLMIFIASFELSAQRPVVENADKNNEVINAVVLSESRMQLPHPQPPPKMQEIKKVESLKPVPLPRSAVAQQPKAQKEVIVIPKKEKVIQKPLQNDLIEKQLLGDLKKETEKQKKIKQKKLEEAFAKEMKSQAAKAIQQELRRESNRLANGQSQKMQGIVDKYKALILQSIEQYWLVPNGVNKSLSSELLIRLAPGGVVLDVQLVKSSGDTTLDRSARTAVLKASPLPVPTASDEFEPFRQFILRVKPENVLFRDSGLSG